MIPIVNRPIIVFFSGIILSYLEMNGYLSPANHTENEMNMETIVGGVLGAVTIISYFLHHTSIEKAKIQAGITSQEEASLFVYLRTFFLSAKSFIWTNRPQRPIVNQAEAEQVTP